MTAMDIDNFPDTLTVELADGRITLCLRSGRRIEMPPSSAYILATDLIDAVMDLRYCGHDSMDGVDGVDIADPDKVWRCRCCGWEGTCP